MVRHRKPGAVDHNRPIAIERNVVENRCSLALLQSDLTWFATTHIFAIAGCPETALAVDCLSLRRFPSAIATRDFVDISGSDSQRGSRPSRE